MVKIISGKVDSGKTTEMIRRYEATRSGDGFVALKKMKGNDIYGYCIRRLGNDRSLMWMIHQKHYQDDFKNHSKFGPYYLNLDVLHLMESDVDEFIAKNIAPIFLDEIGIFELNGGGYHNILKKLLASGLNLVIAVREDLVKPIANYFAIKDYELIQVQREE
ncbi:MAG TPA: nucleoside-triphosphatase [Bacilli bacterium]|nr:nucleoside-triphosphatase [Bacilli bacterium]